MSIVETETINKEPTLKDKMHLIASALRNNNGVEQLYCILNDTKGGMCAMGLLAFRAGVPHDDAINYQTRGYHKILEFYGISKEESNTRLIFNRKITEDDLYDDSAVPRMDERCNTSNINIANGYLTGSSAVILGTLYRLNDSHIKFDTIADIIDYTANTL